MIVPDPNKALELQSERVLLRCLAWGEARNQEAIAILAVVWVAWNRVGKIGASLHDAILKPYAFSCFNPGDPNRELLVHALKWEGRDVWARIDAICELLEQGATVDPTGGATHYVRKELWGRSPKDRSRPKWFESVFIADGTTKETARIGDHVFGVTPG